MKRIMNKHHLWLAIPLVVGLALRLGVLIMFGPMLNLDSDDKGYIDSAKHLVEYGELIYVNTEEPTVHIMPGLPFLLAASFLVFGTGWWGMLSAKLVMIAFGMLGVFAAYKLGERLVSPAAGSVAALLLALYIPQILTDNLIMTEAPFTAAFIGFAFFAVKLGDTHKTKYFYLTVASYIFMILFRPTVVLLPVFFLLYLLARKYPLKPLRKHLAIAALLFLLIMSPWWVRNYVAFGDFIPFSGGAGNPMLLGTYQGHGYKYGEPFNDVVLSLEQEYPEATRYVQNQYQMDHALDRVSTMWNSNKRWFIETYTIIKLKIQWSAPFYWIEIYGVTKETITAVFRVLALAGGLSLAALIAFHKKRRAEWVLLASFIGYFTIINNLNFAYPRYNQPLLPFLFTAIGGAGALLFQQVKDRRHIK
ncbi:glycosyltransferase family 39 protein [Planomicrobium sp. YIM 101495]|uniref:glycosyltransferase family 39 protein n=1 Tax=Planomicrobium sp. YIM 101495 TaxID=2665160 RepID=UPI0012B9F6ED|nr:glycosyltransferase family 39 protein [Planomicrobium sp. YIM 101495]MTD30781.1 hypothetical protein [Planomicrobium sp. YIM 101495]